MSDAQDAPAIDIVFTWVDGNDPAHRAKLDRHLASIGARPNSAAATRFADAGEIEYAVASALRFAPFVRRIHIVSDAQVPRFLREARPDAPWRERVCVVDHRQIFAGHEDLLPTFNIMSIATMLWRLPGLAEQFVVMNDDCMLLRPIAPEDWFRGGRPVLRGRLATQIDREFWTVLKSGLRRLLGRTRPPRLTNQRALSVTAPMAGLKRQYLRVDHVPHPARRSVLERWFAAHPELLRANAQPKLRSVDQFGVFALANHIEIAAGQALIEADERLLYVEPAGIEITRLERVLRGASADPRLLFACIQSLDLAGDEKLALVLRWLDEVIGRPGG